MTSAINTGTIDTTYPKAGINNSTQVWRDNWAGIKNNLDTASSEITDLQSKVLLKSALTGTTLNNDMAGGQISNVLTLGFRKTTYQLGNNLNGIITIDCTKGDVQYGTVTGDSKLDFSKWAPADTMGTVEVILQCTAGQKIALPDNIIYGADTLEGYESDGAYQWINIIASGTRVHYVFSSIDCGTTIEMSCVDRPRSGQFIVTNAGTFSSTGPLSASPNMPLSATAPTTVIVSSYGDSNVTQLLSNYTIGFKTSNTVILQNSTSSNVTTIDVGTMSVANGANHVNISASGTLSATGVISTTSNISVGGNASIIGNITTTGLTATNGNITGNLNVVTDLSVHGNISASKTVNLGSVSNVHITGGSAGQTLITDGSGTLSWYTMPNFTGGALNVTKLNCTDGLEVTGNANFTLGKFTATAANLTVTSGMDVFGNMNLHGNLSVASGDIQMTNSNVTTKNSNVTNVLTVGSTGTPFMTADAVANILSVSGSISGNMVLKSAPVPTSQTAPGVQGEVRFDSSAIYICVVGGSPTATWQKIVYSSW